MKKFFTILSILVLFPIAAFSQDIDYEEDDEGRSKEVVAVASDGYVNIRKAPSTDAAILGRLYTGESTTYYGTKGSWYVIHYYYPHSEDYVTAYVSASPKQTKIDWIGPDDFSWVYANAPGGYATIRSEPSADSEEIGRLYNEGNPAGKNSQDCYALEGVEGEWFMILIVNSDGEQQNGYLHYKECKLLIHGC